MIKDCYQLKIVCLMIFLLGIAYKSQATSRDSVKNYYEYKYEAERAIMDANYWKAVKEYKKAYQYKTPNSSDLYNSFKAAYLCGDSAMAKAWKELGVLHGWNKERFEETQYGKSIKEEGLYQWINTNYDSLHKAALSSNMPKVAKVMDSILMADQSVRPIHTQMSEQEMQKMMHVDSLNIAFLKKYIEQIGYPDFDDIGVFEEFNIPSTIFLVLYHTRFISKDLNELCRHAALAGKLPPCEYAFFIDTQEDIPTYYELAKWDTKNNRPLVLSGKQKEEINKLRAELFLEPLDEYRRKLLFQKDNSHPFFEFVPFMILSEAG